MTPPWTREPGPCVFQRHAGTSLAWLFTVLVAVFLGVPATAAGAPVICSSNHQPGNEPVLAMDGDRFATNRAWAGAPGTNRWWWQVEFPEARDVGAILQVHGDHDFVLRHGPTSYAWEGSEDGRAWRPLPGADQEAERRTFRLHRLARVERVRWVRLMVREASGGFPVLREVEFHGSRATAVPFPEWVVAVNVTHDGGLPGHGREFLPLAREADARLQAQQVWLVDFDDDFVKAEPRPLAAFLSGSFKDWCEVDRSHWRGIQQVLRTRSIPLWASCGGAQGLALVSEYGVDQPWDCPHCRDPRRPKTPLYGHIGHPPGVALACGRYEHCTFERGPMTIRAMGADPAFAGLPEAFTVMESHCGQVEFVPKGWRWIATNGPKGLTRIQCLRLADAPVYAAQFHIEMAGTPDVSRRIMANFLGEARAWQARAAGLGPAQGR